MRNWLCALIPLAMVAVHSVPAHAKQDWILVYSTDDEKHYMDGASIKQTNRTFRVWERVEYVRHSAGWVSSMAYVEYDCAENRTRLLQLTAYYKSGSSRTTSEPLGWSFTTPETIGSHKANIVCS